MRIVLSVKVTSFVSVRILSLFRSIEIGKQAESSSFSSCVRIYSRPLEISTAVKKRKKGNCKKKKYICNNNNSSLNYIAWNCIRVIDYRAIFRNFTVGNISTRMIVKIIYCSSEINYFSPSKTCPLVVMPTTV